MHIRNRIYKTEMQNPAPQKKIAEIATLLKIRQIRTVEAWHVVIPFFSQQSVLRRLIRCILTDLP